MKFPRRNLASMETVVSTVMLTSLMVTCQFTDRLNKDVGILRGTVGNAWPCEGTSITVASTVAGVWAGTPHLRGGGSTEVGQAMTSRPAPTVLRLPGKPQVQNVPDSQPGRGVKHQVNGATFQTQTITGVPHIKFWKC